MHPAFMFISRKHCSLVLTDNMRIGTAEVERMSLSGIAGLRGEVSRQNSARCARSTRRVRSGAAPLNEEQVKNRRRNKTKSDTRIV
eukprot:scaffold324447_cov61-Tisochrysis_lutea.AAC.1